MVRPIYWRWFHTTKRIPRRIKTALDFFQSAHVRSSMITVSSIRKYITRRESHLTINYGDSKYWDPVVGLKQCQTAGEKWTSQYRYYRISTHICWKLSILRTGHENKYKYLFTLSSVIAVFTYPGIAATAVNCNTSLAITRHSPFTAINRSIIGIYRF